MFQDYIVFINVLIIPKFQFRVIFKRYYLIIFNQTKFLRDYYCNFK